MSEVRISIIVPVYGVEKYLSACIESVLNQTFTDFELILVDDGSDDDCGEICDNYSERDNRIVVIHKENGGLSSARNAGIEIAKGEYISFVDGDDTVNKDYLGVLYYLCKSNKCQIGVCNFLLTSKESINLDHQLEGITEILSGKEAVERSCSGKDSLLLTVAWNKLYLKELFRDIKYPTGKIHEDDYTTWKLLWSAEKVVISNLYLYYYLQRPDSIMGRRFNIERLDRLCAYEEKIEFVKKQGMARAYEWLLITYYRLLLDTYNNAQDSHFDESILSDIQARINKSGRVIEELDSLNIIEKNRILFNGMDQIAREGIIKSFGTEWLFRKKEEFLFPFHIVEKHRRIALYGAGEVGKSFARQISTLKYGTIALWVDEKWRNLSKQIECIMPIDAVVRYEYDVLVIAISNPKVAMEIRSNLINWGIPDQKIVWSDPRVVS